MPSHWVEQKRVDLPDEVYYKALTERLAAEYWQKHPKNVFWRVIAKLKGF